MKSVSFDDVWEELKSEDEESRRVFQTAEDTAKLINRLSGERIRQGLTQEELAGKAGLKQSAVARMESVKSVPRLDTVLKVADALGLEMTFEQKTKPERVAVALPGIRRIDSADRAATA
ncbi:MAG: helix-turn-helix transcriptional regulator [Oscillospiraceae bacterium]|nr:helix-turn-helix transcriptional regulator [Oscillospiraceae bacterium]